MIGTLLRKVLVLLAIVVVSTLTFNAEKGPRSDLAQENFFKGVEALKVLNYLDAVTYFSKAYSYNPKSYYGELAYLYLGKSYALYAYAFGDRRGIHAAIGYLNQYPFYYKVPRFIHTQREFVADAYLLLQWYGTAKNIYANLYGETNKVEYMIKYGYASSLEGGIEGYNYISGLSQKGVPADYLDMFYMTMGFYNFNLGRYPMAVEYMTIALNINTHLREDPHLLYRMGVSYYKMGDINKGLLYLELTKRRDPMKIYSERASYYLTLLNLETNNFKDAFLHYKEVVKDNALFYSKFAQVLHSQLWMYEDFLKVYEKAFKGYRKTLQDLAWLNIEDAFGELPTLGIYYFALKEKKLLEGEKDLMKLKKVKLREIVLENDLISFEKFINKVRKPMKNYSPYKREDAVFLRDVYLANPYNYITLLGEGGGIELLARSLVFLGDPKAKEVIDLVPDPEVAQFLRAKMLIVEGKYKEALDLLKQTLPQLSGDDLLEAKLLIGIVGESLKDLQEAVAQLDFKKDRFSPYESIALLKLADLFYENGNLEQAKKTYRRIVETGKKDQNYWWALFRLAVLADMTKDKDLMAWVVNKAREGDNIWSKAIRVLWEG